MIFKLPLITVLLLSSMFAKDFKVASYNVENLFDLHYDGTEYKDYIPNKISSWNHKTYTAKLKNISKVINELDADIIALQEIESLRALKDLLKYTKKYKYYSFVKNKKSAIGLALLSKFEIVETQKLPINTRNKFARPIQKVLLKIENKYISIYNNHWPSKRAAENERVEYALSLQSYLKQHQASDDYILLGDFNSNYNEFQTFKNDKKLNTTYGNTGINQVLNTSVLKKFISKQNILSHNKTVHYNLWLDILYQNRFSYKYRGENNTPDHMLLSKSLFETKNLSYVNNSFQVFKPKYLFFNNTIFRWKMKGKNRVHKGIGYSDHLPIYAIFTTQKYLKILPKKEPFLSSKDISHLYTIDSLEKSITLKNVVVIYKYKNNAIIKQMNNRAVYVYKVAKDLKLGKVYDIKIQTIKNHHGLKEIVKIGNITFKHIQTLFKSLYTQGKDIDLHNYDLQNEIITNLSGVYKKGYLYYSHKKQMKKIKLYEKDHTLLPKSGQNINKI